MSDAPKMILDAVLPKDATAKDWQIFDVSEAFPLIDEMAHQYELFGVPFTHRLPAEKCIFFLPSMSIVATQTSSECGCILGEEVLFNYTLGKAKAEKFNLVSNVKDETLKKVSESTRLFIEGAKRSLIEAKDKTIKGKTIKFGDVATSEQIELLYAQCIARFVGFPVASIMPLNEYRHGRRRLKRDYPLVRFSRISLTSRTHKDQKSQSPGDRRPLHYCRGHWRQNERSMKRQFIDGKWRVWIDGHWKGDPSRGVVLHEYTASLDDIRAKYRSVRF